MKGYTVIAGKGQKLKTVIDALQKLPDKPSDHDILIVSPDSESLAKDRKICGNEVNIIVDSIQEKETQERIALPDARRVFLLDNFGQDTGALLETICVLHKMRDYGKKFKI